MAARNFYIAAAYGPLQQRLSGVRLNLFAPDSYIAQHRPALPPTRLQYDPSRQEVISKDRPFDYLIIGSGPSGSVLAYELRRHGEHVLLLDRGPFIVPGAMETRHISDLIDTRTSIDGGVWIRNGIAVGGGTEVNVDLCFAPTLPAIQAKIKGWRRSGRIGADEFTNAQIASAYKWVKTMVGTRSVSRSEINLNNDALWTGAKLAGLHPKLYMLNTYPPGQSPSPVTDKRSAETQFVLKALLDVQNPLSMIPDADVQRILFENDNGVKKAFGVQVKMRKPIDERGVIADPNGLHIPYGEVFTIRARTIILSAGSLGSPTVLLRSGLTNNQIGRGVILHPSMPILGLFDHPINALDGTEASVYVDDRLKDSGYAFESMAAEPLYAALMSPGPAIYTFHMLQSYTHLAGFGVMLVDTVSPQNRLALDSEGNPQIAYTLSGKDKRRFREGISQAIRVMFLAGASKVYLSTTENILGRPDHTESQPAVLTNIRQANLVEKNLLFTPNRTIVTSAHMQATDKMGATPRDSVVGQDFHVWGTRNLYVVDGSIFPTSIGANPMQSIYTFAKIFADRRNNAN
ncbi:MAG: GMC oxidoreductase [Acidobacteriaceae bacterium]